MKTTILIPKICKVGFNERTDTFTGMLGYIIYFDGKKWRKETSWRLVFDQRNDLLIKERSQSWPQVQ